MIRKPLAIPIGPPAVTPQTWLFFRSVPVPFEILIPVEVQLIVELLPILVIVLPETILEVGKSDINIPFTTQLPIVVPVRIRLLNVLLANPVSFVTVKLCAVNPLRV